MVNGEYFEVGKVGDGWGEAGECIMGEEEALTFGHGGHGVWEGGEGVVCCI